MGEKDYLLTGCKLFLDGKEVTNFFNDGVQVIESNDENSSDFLKTFEPFSGTITLEGKQARRFVRLLCRLERKHRIETLISKLRFKIDKLKDCIKNFFSGR